MLSAEEFRCIALGMASAIESAHMGHPDFRAHGRIFATISPDRRSGMVKLTPEQQEGLVGADPATFAPASGAWGRQGCTMVRLASADEATVRDAMRLAWQNTVAKRSRARQPASATRPSKR